MSFESVLKVRILSLEDELRNPDLIESLHSAFPNFELHVEIFRGSDGRVIDCTEDPLINATASRRILGRDLTSSEAACMLGHHRMQNDYFSGWLLILEDDARLINFEGLEDFYKSQIRNMDSGPVICSLFRGLHGLSSLRARMFGSSKVTRLIKPSTGTVAYFMNDSARDLISSQDQLIGVADWPLWINKLKFYESNLEYFDTYPQSHSFIAEQMIVGYSNVSPYFRENFLRAILGVFDKKVRKDFGGFKYYCRGVLVPFLYRLFE